MHWNRVAALGALGLLSILAGCEQQRNAADTLQAHDSPRASGDANASLRQTASGCLATGNGYLRARIRGALDLDIDWTNAELECDGSVRPDGSGIRLSFAGPLRSDGRRVRMVFGVAHAVEGASARALPTNLTIIFEGENRVFATLGDDRCTVDELRQERIGTPGGPVRPYRVIARGFCIEPAAAMGRDERIVVSRFDFAGQVTFEDVPPVREKPAMPDTLRT